MCESSPRPISKRLYEHQVHIQASNRFTIRTTAAPVATVVRKNSTVVRDLAHHLLGTHKYLAYTCHCSIVTLDAKSVHGEATLVQNVSKSGVA